MCMARVGITITEAKLSVVSCQLSVGIPSFPRSKTVKKVSGSEALPRYLFAAALPPVRGAGFGGFTATCGGAAKAGYRGRASVPVNPEPLWYFHANS